MTFASAPSRAALTEAAVVLGGRGARREGLSGEDQPAPIDDSGREFDAGLALPDIEFKSADVGLETALRAHPRASDLTR